MLIGAETNFSPYIMGIIVMDTILVTQPKARGKEMKPSSTFDSNHVAYQQRETVNMQGDGSLASVPQPLVYEHGASCQEWMSLIELQRLKVQSYHLLTD
jgi:hypothetical protein